MQRSDNDRCQKKESRSYSMRSILPLLIIALLLGSCTKTRLRTSSDIPECVREMIEIFKSQPKGNPPRSITEYTYKKKRVFYVPPQCCDQYSDVFDENCNLLGHPDGGFSGAGDGSLPDFFTEAKDPRLVWKDDR